MLALRPRRVVRASESGPTASSSSRRTSVERPLGQDAIPPQEIGQHAERGELEGEDEQRAGDDEHWT